MYLVLPSASVFRIDDVVLFYISNRHFRHVNEEEAKKERAEALSPIYGE